VTRWVRVGAFEASLSDIVDRFFKPETQDSSKGKRGKKGKGDETLPLSSATWSGYELGTRFPSEVVANDFIFTIGAVLPMQIWRNDETSFLDEYKEGTQGHRDFISALTAFYRMEQFLRQLENFYPLRHLGTKVLAYALLDDPASLAKEPYPPEYFVAEDVGDKHVFLKNIFREWVLGDAVTFRRDFAIWLLQGSQFINKRFLGGNLPISEVEKMLHKSTGNRYPYSPNQNIKHFCAEAMHGYLFFEHLGAPLDAIMAFGKELTLSNDLRELKVGVITPKGDCRDVKVTALWAGYEA
jgi:hypothetical protein